MYAVMHTLGGLEELDHEPDLDPPQARVSYSQDWTAYNLAQTTEKAMFQVLLRDLCYDLPELPRMLGAYPGGRKPHRLKDMLFSIVFKIYSTVSGRRFMTDLKEAHDKGYIKRTPHFNSLYNYLDKLELTPILRHLITVTALPLKSVEVDFAVDSTGISNNRFVKWFNVKHGKEIDYSDWVKLHLMCGVKTNVVTSVEISTRHEHDTNYFAPLVETTAQHFNMEEVSADLAYSSRDNLHTVMRNGGVPYIPFKKNATGETGGDQLWRIMFHYYSMRRDEFLSHYHKRSNAETTMSMIKGKFGDAVRGKSETAQINEVLCKVLAHNICCLIHSFYELGIEPSFCAESELAQYLTDLR